LKHTIEEFIGISPAVRTIQAEIEYAASCSAKVLITGESGVGKEVASRLIHQLSDRATAPFLAINCVGVPESLLESELFGHVRGSFTGAHRDRPGLLEMAHRGTLFLDEIGDLPLALQAKILRAIEERRFERVGGTVSLQVDVRVVAATNRKLKAAVAARQFREDLYFRLSVFPIDIPPLRSRTGDIEILARHFVERYSRDLKKKPLTLTPQAMEELCAYAWPGNVRELQNCIERAVILAEGDAIHPRHLNLSFRDVVAPAEEISPWDQVDLSGTLADVSRRALAEVEKRKVTQALREAGGNKPKAAEALQVSYKTLLMKLKDYQID
jgi:transcriptional regulator with PAS, ATPase and Fis domain